MNITCLLTKLIIKWRDCVTGSTPSSMEINHHQTRCFVGQEGFLLGRQIL